MAPTSSSMVPNLVQGMARHSRWFALGLAAVVLALGYLLAIAPILKEIRTIGRESRDFREQELTQLRDHLTELVQKKASIKAISTERLSLLSRALPASKDVPGLMVEIPRFFESHGYSVGPMSFTESTVDFGTEKPRETVKQLDVAVDLGGVTSYADFKRMLGTITGSLRFFELRSITYTPASSAYALTLVTYYIDEGTAL